METKGTSENITVLQSLAFFIPYTPLNTRDMSDNTVFSDRAIVQQMADTNGTIKKYTPLRQTHLCPQGFLSTLH